MQVAAYCRVSSRGQSVATQKDAIRRAAKARGDRVVRWYCETVSGGRSDPPVLQNLRRAAREGRVRKLYVYKLDRLGRRGIRDTLGVLAELRAHGCEVASVSEPFPLAGPMSEVVVAVIAWAAQFEREQIGDRIAAARKRVEASGGTWGRRRAVDPGTLRRARAMKNDGATIREISAALKIPKSTLSDALSEKGHYAKESRVGKK